MTGLRVDATNYYIHGDVVRKALEAAGFLKAQLYLLPLVNAYAVAQRSIKRRTGGLVVWLFNGTSTQKGQFVPTAGRETKMETFSPFFAVYLTASTFVNGCSYRLF